MATFASINFNGNITSEPTGKALANGSHVWNFSMAVNAVDKASKEKATIWVKFSFYAPADHEVMSKAEKGTCLMVSATLPYALDEYSASYSGEKKSMNLSLQAFGVTRGIFDSKKAEGQKETSSSQKEDNLVPADKGDFKIPGEGRPKF